MSYSHQIRDAAAEMRACGYTYEEISESLGPSKPTLTRWFNDEKKFRAEEWPPERVEIVVNRSLTGDSVAWLSRIYGISRTTIYRWQKKKRKM